MLAQFLATVGYPESGDGYAWGIDDKTTIYALEMYLETYLS